MKLSIEEKAQAYDIALKKIKMLLGSGSSCSREELEYVFPQLKESEDEKIRKELLQFVDLNTLSIDERHDKWIAWIEKQGKNNMGISEATKQELKDNLNKALAKETPESWNEFLGEQKSAWSEEDERLRDSCIRHIEDELESINNDKYGHSEIISDLKESCRERIDWLEKLKGRYTWKPSDEQMHYLYWIANVKLGDSVVEQEVSKHLNELYEDLKKLKGE